MHIASAKPIGERPEGWALEKAFPEADAKLPRDDAWRLCIVARWRGDGRTFRLEARIGTLRARHTARDVAIVHRSHEVVGDNMGATLPFDKGRAYDCGLSRSYRRQCALFVAANMDVRFRWIASESNRYADLASRGGSCGPSAIQRAPDSPNVANSSELHDACVSVSS